MEKDVGCKKKIIEILKKCSFLKTIKMNPDIEIKMLGIAYFESILMIILLEQKFSIDFIKLAGKKNLPNFTINELDSLISKHLTTALT